MDKKGKTTTFIWLKNISINQDSVVANMKAALARWKIKNKTYVVTNPATKIIVKFSENQAFFSTIRGIIK